MKCYLYIIRPLDRIFHDSSVFLLQNKISQNKIEKTFNEDPYYYFANESKLDRKGIIGFVNLGNVFKNDNWLFYPFCSYIHNEYRGNKLGLLMYLSAIDIISKCLEYSNKLPKLAQHTVIEPDLGPISESASYIYDALVRREYISKIEKINGGNVYKINKYPNINTYSDPGVYKLIIGSYYEVSHKPILVSNYKLRAA